MRQLLIKVLDAMFLFLADWLFALVDRLARSILWLTYHMKMLKHRPKLWWDRLYIREDEFHHSLDMDANIMMDMNERDREKYIADLVRRRQIAHDREMEDWYV